MNNGINFGFELEVINVEPRRLARILQSSNIGAISGYIPQIGDKWWGIGVDSSMNGDLDNSAEIRSPVNPSIDEITRVIKITKQSGAETNKKCGLHIHVSHLTKQVGIKLQTVSSWESRKEWCGRPFGKYMPINRINPNRLEVRCFNGSLNLRHILRSIKITLSSIVLDDAIEIHNVIFI